MSIFSINETMGAVEKHTKSTSHFAELGVVNAVGDDSVSVLSFTSTNGKKRMIQCILNSNLAVQIGDVVCMVYLDNDQRSAFKRYKETGVITTKDADDSAHNTNLGVIISIIYRSGE